MKAMTTKITASQVLLKVTTSSRPNRIEVYLKRGGNEAYIGVADGFWRRRADADEHVNEMTDEQKAALAEKLLAEMIPKREENIKEARAELKEAEKELQMLLWIVGR